MASTRSLSTTFTLILSASVWSALYNPASAADFISLPLWSISHEDLEGYATNITIGANNDTATVLLNPHSASTWINPGCPSTSPFECQSSTVYDIGGSKTKKDLGQTRIYDAPYSGSRNGSVTALQYTEQITVGDITIKDYPVGMVEWPRNVTYGEIGLVPGEGDGNTALIDALAAQGGISSKAFSLQLPTKDKQGALIFGGLDTKKYKCALSKQPLTVSTSSTTLDYGYNIHLTSLRQTLPNKTSVTHNTPLFSTPGLKLNLDPSAQYAVLPDDLFTAIGSTYPNATLMPEAARLSNVQYNPDTRAYKVDCTAPEGSIDFVFGDAVISIPNQQFVIEDQKVGGCWLKMRTLKGEAPRLAEAFFRNAYVVLDVGNGEAWVGQADDCGSEVRGIGEGEGGVPVVEGCGCKGDGTETQDTTSPTGSPRPTGSAVCGRRVDLWKIGVGVLLSMVVVATN